MSESVSHGGAGFLEGLIWKGERGMSESVGHGGAGFLEGLIWRGEKDVRVCWMWRNGGLGRAHLEGREGCQTYTRVMMDMGERGSSKGSSGRETGMSDIC
jgi:hypothetical protein